MLDSMEQDYLQSQAALAEGRKDEARKWLKRMVARDEQDPRTIETLGDFARLRGEFEKADKLYRQLDAFENPKTRGLGKFNLAYLHLGQDDPEGARPLFVEAIAFFREARATDRTVASLTGWGHVQLSLGEFREAEAAFRQALQEIEASEDPGEFDAEAAAAYEQIGTALRQLGDLDAGETHLRDALSRYEELGDDFSRASVVDALGVIEQIRGRYDAAESLHLEAVELNEAIEHAEGLSVNFGNLTLLNLHRQQFDRAEEFARKAHALDEALGNENGVAHFHMMLGRIAYERGDYPQAENSLLKSLKLYKKCGDAEDLASVYSQLGVTYRRAGRLTEAEPLILKSLAMVEEMGHRDGVAAMLDELASLRKTEGRTDEARELWERSLKLYDELRSSQAAEIRAHLELLDALA